jgi:transcription elongation factor GreB
MSRAFVKESNGDEADELPPRPPRVQPCYMTALGVARLKREAEAIQVALIASAEQTELGAKTEFKRQQLRLREIARILAEVVAVDLPPHPTPDIRFGATVTLQDDSDKTYQFQIVGEDEVAPAEGRISWVSPLGRQLIGRRPGDFVTWLRPAGNLELEVRGFEYRIE